MSAWAWLRQEAAYGVVAVQFLTRLPVPVLSRFEPIWLDRSVAYFPLAGMIVGAISASVFVGGCTIWSPGVAAILAIAAGIAATGAFHEDGLADSADGLGGGLTREQRLTIMKDSRIGTYGTVALVSVLGLKAACLSGLAPHEGAVALLAAHGGGRIVPAVASAVLPYGGETIGAKVAPVTPTPARLAFAIVTGLVPFALLPLGVALLALAAGAVASAVLLAHACRAIGGHTGDVLGGAEQLFEVAVLLVIAGFFA